MIIKILGMVVNENEESQNIPECTVLFLKDSHFGKFYDSMRKGIFISSKS